MSTLGNAKGRKWERIASEYVARQGVEILGRGFISRFGEIDLIGRHGEEIVVFEIRARSHRALVSSIVSVDRHKQRKLIATARYYLCRNPELAGSPLRFDVIGIDGIDSSKPRIQWIRNAFEQA